jgi:hypothetical protein
MDRRINVTVEAVSFLFVSGKYVIRQMVNRGSQWGKLRKRIPADIADQRFRWMLCIVRNAEKG